MSSSEEPSTSTAAVQTRTDRTGLRHRHSVGMDNPLKLIHNVTELNHCKQCGKSFSQQQAYELHQCFLYKNEKTDFLMSGVKRLICPNEHWIHRRSHLGEKPYQCDQCGKRFCYPCTLEEHLRIHSGEKHFCCNQCGNKFSDFRSFGLHKLIHTEETLHQSGNIFSQSGQETHQPSHTGSKQYLCDQCGKTIKGSSSYKAHQRIHTGEKPYCCDVCGQTFRGLSTYKQHQRIHTGEKPYVCEQCGKKFSCASTYKHHQRTHTGEKPYCCHLCGKKYSSVGAYKHHQRIHTGETIQL